MSRKLTTEEFITKAKTVHGDKYDYSLVDYIGNRKKVKIVCKNHGEFEQNTSSHIGQKCGCMKCYLENKNFNTDIFIEKANQKHNFIYDYSLVKYVDSKTKVEIICKNHGIFLQSPFSHLSNRGCPICKSSKGEFKIRNWLEINNIRFIQEYKFNECKNKRPLRLIFSCQNIILALNLMVNNIIVLLVGVLIYLKI